MKRRRIIAGLTLGISALMITTGWSVLAGGDWPPEPYRMFSPEGAWIEVGAFGIPGDVSVVTLSPVDPATGTGFGVKTNINVDPTCGGQIPEATSWSPWFFTIVRIGPDSGRVRGVCFVTKDEKPTPRILVTMVAEFDSTILAPGAMDYEGTWSLYSPGADKDGDGLPDAGEPPLVSFPMVGHLKRI